MQRLQLEAIGPQISASRLPPAFEHKNLINAKFLLSSSAARRLLFLCNNWKLKAGR